MFYVKQEYITITILVQHFDLNTFDALAAGFHMLACMLYMHCIIYDFVILFIVLYHRSMPVTCILYVCINVLVLFKMAKLMDILSSGNLPQFHV